MYVNSHPISGPFTVGTVMWWYCTGMVLCWNILPARWNEDRDGSLEWRQRWLAGMGKKMARWNGEKDGSLEWGKRWLTGFDGMTECYWSTECYCGTKCCSLTLMACGLCWNGRMLLWNGMLFGNGSCLGIIAECQIADWEWIMFADFGKIQRSIF